MAVGLPLKTTYADGDVYSASDVNDTNGTINAYLAPSLGYSAGKNAIINGAMFWAQRGTSFSNPASSAYTLDRWAIQYDGTAATRTVSRQSFTPGTAPVAGYEGVYFLRCAVTGAGIGNTYHQFFQRIENVQTYAGQTVMLSFWAKADSARTIGWQAVQNFGSGGSGAVGINGTSFSATTSWQRFTASFSVPSISGKTVGTGSSLELNILMPTNTTATIDIWGVQLENGSTATAFQTATGTIQGELAACQRYYYRTTTGAGAFRASGMNITGAIADVCIPLQTTMRLAPTAIEVTGTAADYEIRHQNTTTACSAVPTLLEGSWNSLTIRMTVASGLTTGQACQGRTTTNGYIGWSAEL